AVRGALPRNVPVEAGGILVSRDPEASGSGLVEHALYLGFPLPQATAGPDGRKLGGGSEGEGEREVNREDIRKLVGGYATGTLTDAERALLFEAALDDQDIFDDLADEHA